jgi:L-rhamnose mutarotase
MKSPLLATSGSAIRSIPAIAAILLLSFSSFAQPDTAYQRTIKERSAKIVNTLEITDSHKYSLVLDQVMNQYFGLNEIHDVSKKIIADIKSKGLAKEETDKAILEQEQKKSSQLLQLHNAFIGLLKKNLSDAQVDKVKDGMTYNVLNVTYTAYLDKIPGLSTEQKEKIYVWLKEARELAMDEGSSDDKHKVFGKYKGRINNYLSDQGYDLRKEEKDWQARLKERREQEAQKKNTRN